MALTPPPTIPDRTDPATFADRADAYVAWWAVVVPEIQNVVEQVANGARALVGGTANAITLTTELGYTSITGGTTITFIPTSDNTGAVTVAMDGDSPRTVTTESGDALPAGYIRNGVPTTLIRNAGGYVALRLMEYGTNANGQYYRYANGLQVCTHTVTGDAASDVTWTYASPFISVPFTHGMPTSQSRIFTMGASDATTTAMLFRIFVITPGSPANVVQSSASARVVAIGRWY